jgi:cyanate permease
MTGMMLGLGYALSSLAPFLFGAVRDAGSFTAGLWLIVATRLADRRERLRVTPASRSPP